MFCVYHRSIKFLLNSGVTCLGLVPNNVSKENIKKHEIIDHFSSNQKINQFTKNVV